MNSAARPATTAVALVFLVSLWAYQVLPPGEGGGPGDVLAPVQALTHTDRRFRMYAPDPRSRKNVAELRVVLADGTVRDHRFDDPSVVGLDLGPIAREKWANLVDHLVRGVRGETSRYPAADARRTFERLAAEVVRRARARGEEVRTIDLRVRPVDFSRFLEPPVWHTPRRLASFDAPTGTTRWSLSE